MATLNELRAAGNTTSLKRGTTDRNLGGKAVAPTTIVNDNKSALQQFGQKVSDVLHQGADIAGSVAGATAKFVANTPKYIYQDIHPFLKGIASTVTNEYGQDLHNINTQQAQLDRQMAEATQQYKSGKMSKDNYTKISRDIANSYQDLSKAGQQIQTATDRGNVVESAVMTGADILSAGRLQVGTSEAVNTAAHLGQREVVNSLIGEGASNLEKQILRTPVVRSLVERNIMTAGKVGASESIQQLVAREGKNIATGYLIKRPIFYQSNLGDAKTGLNAIMQGNYPQAARSAAWLGIQMIDGGPLGAFAKGAGWARTSLKQLAHGKGSFIDTLSTRIGDGNSTQIARFLDTTSKKAPNESREIEKIYRIAQEMNLQASGEDVNLAVDNFLRPYIDSGINLKNVTPSQLYKDMKNWHDADTLWDKTVRQGIIPGMDKVEGAKFTPVRWDAAARDGVAETVWNAKDPQQALQAVQKMAEAPGNGWGNNNLLMARVENILKTATSKEEAVKAIRAIDAAATTPDYIPKRVAEQLAKLGYTIAEPVGGRAIKHLEIDDTRKLISGAMNGSDIFDPSIAPMPAMEALTGALRKAGISPESSNRAAVGKLSESVVANIDNTTAAKLGLNLKGDAPKGGQAILSELQRYIENKRGVFGFGKSAASDIRQLTPGEIQQALPGLHLTRGDAKQLSKAIMQGYLEVPLEFRGAGDKIVDALFRYNPLQKYYSRTQSALRYAYNPFFRTQEEVETSLLSGISGGNRMTNALSHNLLWNKSRQELDSAVKVLDDARIFSSSMYGEAAQDQVLGRITANITNGQKRDLAGLALDIAKRKGISIEELAAQHTDEVDDALRVVVQYPRKGFLASPLARTLNFAFFPMRYNFKVTMVAAQALAKQPPAIQKATLHSLLTMSDWLKSDEGIAWQAKHADALQVFNWITPINSIEYTLNLLHHKPNSMGEIGMLGGLPLGVISQILDSQGIINLNTPYVNPKTGDVFPKNIPKSTQARAGTALVDLLGSMFTYPGRTLGLPGKGQVLRDTVKKFIATNGTDFEKNLQEDKLTELDKRWIRVLKGDNSKEAIDALYNAPAPGQYNGYTIPPKDLPWKVQPVVLTQPTKLTPRTGLPSKSKKNGKKAKKIAVPITSVQ